MKSWFMTIFFFFFFWPAVTSLAETYKKADHCVLKFSIKNFDRKITVYDFKINDRKIWKSLCIKIFDQRSENNRSVSF